MATQPPLDPPPDREELPMPLLEPDDTPLEEDPPEFTSEFEPGLLPQPQERPNPQKPVL
jgi:hypothetical protein